MPINNPLRNIITLLLVLTLCNLAASFAALRAVKTARADVHEHIERIDVAITQLTGITSKLCAEHGDVCTSIAPAPVTAAK